MDIMDIRVVGMSGCVQRKIFRSSLSAFFPAFLSPILSPLLFLLILSLLLPTASTPLYSQLGPHLLFRNISIEKGLSQNSVLSVAVDHEGFLWFGTESGLNKFDGYQFTVYLPIEGDPHSLSNSWINALLVDRTGTLWAGTENGLNQFIAKREQFIRYLHDPSSPNSLSSSRILTLFEDRQGRLWIGTDRGLNLFDRNAKNFIRYQHDPARPHQTLSSDQVRAIAQDRLGYIWIGTAGGGLNRLDPSTGQIIQIRAGAVAPVLPGYEDETASAVPAAGHLSPGGNAPFISTSSEMPSPTSTSRDSNSAATSSIPQTAGPAQAPRYLPPPTSHIRISSSLPDDFINALLIEPEPRPAAPDQDPSSSGQSSRSTPSTPSAADIIWIGTASSGLIRYLPASGEFKIYHQAPAIAPASAGNPALVIPGSPAAALSTSLASSSQVPSSLSPQSPQSSPSPQSPSPSSALSPGSRPRPAALNLPLGRPAASHAASPASSATSTSSSTALSSSPQASSLAALHTNPQGLPDLSSISDNAVNCLIRDHDGSLWVGTDSGGLNHFYPSNGIFISYKYKSYDLSALPDNRVLALLRTPDDILWIGTYRGISQLNLERQYFKRFLSNPQDPFSLQQPAVRAFCEHSSGFTYVGTDGGGISAFDLEHKIVFHLRADPRHPDSPYSLSSDRIFCLLEDRDADHTLWIGTLYGGLNRYNPATGRFIHYRANPSRPGSLPEDHIRSLLLDRNNTLWVGTVSSGLVYFDRTSNRFKRPGINKIQVNPPGAPGRPDPSTSSATSKPAKPKIKGVSDPVPKADTVLPNPITRGRIFHMVEDQKGNLWLADYETGLVRFTPSSGEVEIFVNDPRNPNSLSSNSIISVFVDSQGLVWAGTNGGGLNRLDPATLTFTRYNEAHGLPSSVVYSILEDDDGFLWLSTNRGLSRFDPRTKHFRNFDVHDGLQGYEFNGNAHLRSRSGYIYFGGINGFNVFNPGEIKESDYRPPVRLTRLLIQNRPVRPEQQIDGKTILNNSLSKTRYLELTWKHRVVAFEFVALDYTSPDKNQYAYMLEGFDREWNYAGSRRFASYSNLPPGTYTFRVKATNCDGVWDEAGASLAIRVIPPFWRTWWFYLLEVLAVAGAFYGMYRYRLSRISRRQQELERLVAQRTEELRLVNDKLKLLAITDELTGLSNYRRFRDFLEYEWRRAHRTRRPLSVIITDLDDFKLFNDTYGHQAGDECLKKVALVMLKCCQRSSDLVCRYGGDEFAIVLPETDTTGAYLVAERIREAIASTDFNDPKLKEINGRPSGSNNNVQPVRLTMCLGLATMNPVEGGGTNEIIARADQALYRAKTAGKNRTVV